MITQQSKAVPVNGLPSIAPAAAPGTRFLELNPQEEDLTGSSLGDFELLSPIDQGEMATVYAAQQQPLRRIVAVKVLRPHRKDDARSIKCFQREAVAAARLAHSGIAQIHAAGVVDGRHYLAMEYVDGCSLEDRIAALSRDAHAPWVDPGSDTLQVERCHVATHMVAAIGDALQHAHEHGVVHCDINPRNIVLDQRNRPHLVDFGLARVDGDNAGFSGSVAGTLHYMSPEQLLGGGVEVDHRTDIFSVGMLLYEMLTLHRPFDGVAGQQLVFDLVFREPLPIQELNPSVSEAMQRVCNRAMAKSPEDRFRDMAEFVDALRACSPGGVS
jgi:serine/threonine protein kinase